MSSLCFTNRYLWVQNGKRVTSDSFCAKFKATMLNYCECNITPSSFRQAAVGLAREHIPPTLFIEDITIDEAAHHGGPIAHSHYGAVDGDLPYLTADSVWRHRTVNREWHNILGVGKCPPPVPLRLIPYLSGGSPNPSVFTGSRPTGGVPVTQDLVEELSELVLGKVSELLLAKVQRTLMDELVPALIEKISVHKHHTGSVQLQPGQPSSGRSFDLEDDYGDFQWTPPIQVGTSQSTTTTSLPSNGSTFSTLPPSSFQTSTTASPPSNISDTFSTLLPSSFQTSTSS